MNELRDAESSIRRLLAVEQVVSGPSGAPGHFSEAVVQHAAMRSLLAELAAAGVYQGCRAAPRIVPSAEASGGTVFLQISVGCRHNGCLFCPFFKDIAFQEKPLPTIEEEIRLLAAECLRRALPVRRVMLLDADALDTPQQKLEQILGLVRAHFPRYRATNPELTAYDDFSGHFYFKGPGLEWRPVEVSSFCHTESVLSKGLEGLRRLQCLGLGLLWWGLESGCTPLLRRMGKANGWPRGEERARLLEAGEILHRAGIYFVAIVLVGLGGERFYEAHVEETTSLLRELNPPGVAFSDLVVVPGTPYAQLVERGILDVLSPERMAAQRRAFEQIAITAPQYDYEVSGSTDSA